MYYPGRLLLVIVIMILTWLALNLNAMHLKAADAPELITQEGQLQSLYLEIQDFLSRSLGGIAITPPPLVKLADKDEVQFHYTQNTGWAQDIIGFYQPSYPEQIYILAGFSRIKTAAVLCHEYAHAWQSRNCPLQEVALKEGFATWVEYKYLLSKQQILLAQQLRSLTDADYGKGLNKILEMEVNLGIPRLVEWVKTAEYFPKI